MKSSTTTPNGGPSPRGWGNRPLRPPSQRPCRAIPTRVGKSCTGRSGRWMVPGHPHAGGEITGWKRNMARRSGPSPRGWGNRDLPASPPRTRRAIPTRVGKSTCLPRTRSRSSGHPHAGGEIPASRGAVIVPGGPSPRGWGNLAFPERTHGEHRAIPTRVGKSGPLSACPPRSPGHPHAGGEISRVPRSYTDRLRRIEPKHGRANSSQPRARLPQNGQLSGSIHPSAISRIPEISTSFRPVFPSGPIRSTT